MGHVFWHITEEIEGAEQALEIPKCESSIHLSRIQEMHVHLCMCIYTLYFHAVSMMYGIV